MARRPAGLRHDVRGLTHSYTTQRHLLASHAEDTQQYTLKSYTHTQRYTLNGDTHPTAIHTQQWYTLL